MLNFNKLQPIVSDKYSFVGIQKQGYQLQLYLPKGFDTKNFNTYDSKRDIYFLLYKIFRRYKQICTEKENLKRQVKSDRDGVIINNGSVQKIMLPEGDDKEVVFYSKLDAIGKILDAYNEPKIVSLAYRLQESEDIDYSQIHQYYDRAKYLIDGAAYIDVMDIRQLQLRYKSTDIVGMYCYILSEVKQQLEEEISPDLQALAEDFIHRYFNCQNGIFQEEYYHDTLDILKEALETIEHRTLIKDADYWDFHDAIELFLYGDLSQETRGNVWGISNFHSVWESMCLNHLLKNIDPSRLLYVDTSYLSSTLISLIKNQIKSSDLGNAFKINSRPLRPDAIFLSSEIKLLNNYVYLLKEYSWFKIDKNKVYKTVWNDYQYQTAFKCKINNDFEGSNFIVRISYFSQPKNHHTFIDLAQIYQVLKKKIYIDDDKQYSEKEHYLLVNSRLPKKFYSCWKIKLEKLDEKVLAAMYQLNHIFIIAIENRIFSADAFYNFITNTFLIKSKPYENHNSKNSFKSSLFHDYLIDAPHTLANDDWMCNKSVGRQQIVAAFQKFVNIISYINIIDVKYKPVHYYFDKNKCEEIKSRDIRKQFVYEYLLQQHLKNNNKFNKLPIKSSFWLPTDNESQHMTKVEPEYLNDYIELNKVSFNVIAKSYLE